MDKKEALMRLNHISGMGPLTIKKLQQSIKSLERVFDFSEKDLIAHGLSEKIAKKIKAAQLDKKIEQDYRWQSAPSQHILTWFDDDYPACLKEISDPPPVLYAKGNLDCLRSEMLAIIGTRKPSVAGSRAAFEFARDLGAHAMTIVSGLARGVDGEAHKGCISANGYTIAILGAGIDCIYPRQHATLAIQVEKNGLLLSEFPLGTAPLAGHFPRRNRIISGLSLATLVIEASLRSGSLITAEFALEQNRSVMALPGSIFNPEAQGCHALLQQGAALVTTPREVLEELCVERRFKGLSQVLANPKGETGSLMKYIGFDVTTVDNIVDRSSLPVEDVITDLAELELQGHIKLVPGGYIRCIQYERK